MPETLFRWKSRWRCTPSPTAKSAPCPISTVMAYLATPEDLKKAAHAFAKAVNRNGKVLIDIPFQHLFIDHVHEHPGFRRDVHFEKLEDNQYRYSETTLKAGDGGCRYENTFLLKAWAVNEVVTVFEKENLFLRQDLTDVFQGSGHHYLLFENRGAEAGTMDEVPESRQRDRIITKKQAINSISQPQGLEPWRFHPSEQFRKQMI